MKTFGEKLNEQLKAFNSVIALLERQKAEHVEAASKFKANNETPQGVVEISKAEEDDTLIRVLKGTCTALNSLLSKD